MGRVNDEKLGRDCNGFLGCRASLGTYSAALQPKKQKQRKEKRMMAKHGVHDEGTDNDWRGYIRGTASTIDQRMSYT